MGGQAGHHHKAGRHHGEAQPTECARQQRAGQDEQAAPAIHTSQPANPSAASQP